MPEDKGTAAMVEVKEPGEHAAAERFEDVQRIMVTVGDPASPGGSRTATFVPRDGWKWT